MIATATVNQTHNTASEVGLANKILYLKNKTILEKIPKVLSPCLSVHHILVMQDILLLLNVKSVVSLLNNLK
jgi:hypothetical protein